MRNIFVRILRKFQNNSLSENHLIFASFNYFLVLGVLPRLEDQHDVGAAQLQT